MYIQHMYESVSNHPHFDRRFLDLLGYSETLVGVRKCSEDLLPQNSIIVFNFNIFATFPEYGTYSVGA